MNKIYKNRIGILDTQDPPPVVFLCSKPDVSSYVYYDAGITHLQQRHPVLQTIRTSHIKLIQRPILHVEHPLTRQLFLAQVLCVEDFLIVLIDQAQKLWYFDTELWWPWQYYTETGISTACMIPYANRSMPFMLGIDSLITRTLNEQMTYKQWCIENKDAQMLDSLLLFTSETYHWQDYQEDSE